MGRSCKCLDSIHILYHVYFIQHVVNTLAFHRPEYGPTKGCCVYLAEDQARQIQLMSLTIAAECPFRKPPFLS